MPPLLKLFYEKCVCVPIMDNNIYVAHGLETRVQNVLLEVTS